MGPFLVVTACTYLTCCTLEHVAILLTHLCGAFPSKLERVSRHPLIKCTRRILRVWVAARVGLNPIQGSALRSVGCVLVLRRLGAQLIAGLRCFEEALHADVFQIHHHDGHALLCGRKEGVQDARK